MEGRKMLKCGLLIGSALLCSLILIGCSDDPDQKRVVANGEEDETSVSAAAQSISGAGSSELSVSIIPSVATVDTELRAIAGGNPASPEFEWQLNGAKVEGESSNRLPVGRYSKGDRVSVTMRSDMKTVTASTIIVNSPPKIIESRFIEPRLHAGVDVEIAVETEDADGDQVETHYVWTRSGEIITGLDDNRLPGNLFQKGDRISFTAVPNDGTTDGSAFIANEFTIPNGAPRFVSTYPLKFSNFLYSYPARAEDPDGDALRYRLETGPEGMIIDPQNGELRWQINTNQGGEHHVKITAEDTDGLQATQEFALTITMPE
jgi:hypothetical protein